MPDEAHIIFKSSDPGIHGIKAFTHKCSMVAELCEDFSQQRRGSVPLWWRRWCTLVGNRRWQILLVDPLTIHVLTITKVGNNTVTNGKRPFNLDKWFIIQGNFEMMKKEGNKVRI